MLKGVRIQAYEVGFAGICKKRRGPFGDAGTAHQLPRKLEEGSMNFAKRSHLSINQFPNAKSLNPGETVLIRVTKLPSMVRQSDAQGTQLADKKTKPTK